jgi:CheY-like chemotaxis protein
MRILVIEDEEKTSAYLKKGLEESGYAVDVANDGADGLILALEENYDVIVLDVMHADHGRLGDPQDVAREQGHTGTVSNRPRRRQRPRAWTRAGR